MKVNGMYHRHLNGAGSLIRKAVVEYPIQQVVRRCFFIREVKAASDSGSISDQKEKGRLDTD